MCGILSIYSEELSENGLEINLRKGLNKIKYRGIDGQGEWSGKNIIIGHILHSIVGFTSQPLCDKNNILAINCEIYNWKELAKEYNLKVDNDAELVFRLLIKKGINAVDEFDGVFAFVFYDGNKLYVARDIIGEKPLWYCHREKSSKTNYFSVGSEKKALFEIGCKENEIKELNPRHIILFDTKNKKIKFSERKFFKLKKTNDKYEKAKKVIDELLNQSVSKRIPDKKIKTGVLFSGGVDSDFIALKLRELGCEPILYISTAGYKGFKAADDLTAAKEFAKKYNFKLRIAEPSLEEIEKSLNVLVPLIEDHNVTKVGVALPFFFASKMAREDGIKVLFSGLGSEEIFAGYQRHKDSLDINNECLSGLLKLYERDLYRDDVITMFHNIELRLPFLDLKLIDYALNVNEKFKIKDNVTKYIFRDIASDSMSNEFAFRKKIAAQYGSNFHKALEKLAGKKKIALYLKDFYEGANVPVGVLFSGGKDSNYALWLMKEQGYPIKCLIIIKPKSEESFMFHHPGIDLAIKQAELMGIPYIVQETKGEKEKELKDLEIAVKRAIEEFKIEGLVTGALFSSYQRDRVELVAEKLQLKLFHPLWHMNQMKEVENVVSNGFEFIIVSVSADGLEKKWVGRKIDNKNYKELMDLAAKFRFNPNGEGGEYETITVKSPMFKKDLVPKIKSIVGEKGYWKAIFE